MGQKLQLPVLNYTDNRISGFLPKLDMTISGGDEIISVFRERYGFHFGRDFVGRHLV
jgi:hypothetical protein